jgi:hypothetical protein
MNVFRLLWGSLLLGSSIVVAAPPPDKTVGGTALDPSGRGALTGLRIQYQMDTLDLKKKDGRWWVNGRGLPADSARVEKDLDLLYGLHDRERITYPKNASLEPYGLQIEEVRTVQLISSRGKPVRLELGMNPAEPGTTYWKVGGKPQIFRVQGHAGAISAEVEAALDRHLIPDFWPGDLTSIQVSWKDSTGAAQGYHLIHDVPDTVWMVAPDTALLPPRKAWDVLYQADQWAIDAFVAPGENVPPPPASPDVSIRLTLKSGVEYSLVTGGADGRYYYVRHPLFGTWVKVLRERFHGFRLAPAYLKKGVELGPLPDDGITRGLPPPGTGVYAPHKDPDSRIDGDGDPHDHHEDH